MYNSSRNKFPTSIGASTTQSGKLDGSYTHQNNPRPVEYRFYSDEEMRARSVLRVTESQVEQPEYPRGPMIPTQGGVLDRRMGLPATARHSRCGLESCQEGPGRCPGRWGHIELPVCIVTMLPALVRCVEGICLQCETLLPSRLAPCTGPDCLARRVHTVNPVEWKEGGCRSIVGVMVCYRYPPNVGDITLNLTTLRLVLETVEERYDSDLLLARVGVRQPSLLLPRVVMVTPPKLRRDKTVPIFGATQRLAGGHTKALLRVINANRRLWGITLELLMRRGDCPTDISIHHELGDVDALGVTHLGSRRWHIIKSGACTGEMDLCEIMKRYKSAIGKLAFEVALLRDGGVSKLSPKAGGGGLGGWDKSTDGINLNCFGGSFNGLWDILDGSQNGGSKQGLLQQGIMGKRNSNALRGVAMSDSSLSYSAVGIPMEAMLCLQKEVGVFCKWGDSALRPENQSAGNLWRVISYIEEPRCELGGYIALSQISTENRPDRHWDLATIDHSQRQDLIAALKRQARRPESGTFYFQATQVLHEGDVVTVGRSPKHHAGNGVVSRIKPTEGSTIRVPTAPWKLAAGDFDGDNADISVPRGMEARAEAWELHGAHRSIATGSGRVDVQPAPNCILGLWSLTDPRRTSSPDESIRFYREVAGAITIRQDKAFEELAEERLHVDFGVWLPIHRSETWMLEAIDRIRKSAPNSWDTCVAELLSLCIPVGLDAEVVGGEEVYHMTSPVWHFHTPAVGVQAQAHTLLQDILRLCADDYLVLSLNLDGELLEGLMSPPPQGSRMEALHAVGVFELQGGRSKTLPLHLGMGRQGGTTTIYRGIPGHRLGNVTLSAREGRFRAPVPRLTADLIQELYNHVLYCSQGRGVIACINCLEQLASEASQRLGVVASSPMDFRNAAMGRSPIEGMRLVSERAIVGDRYFPPTAEGGLFGGGVATCIEAGLKGSKNQLLQMGVALGDVVGRHCDRVRTVTSCYMKGLSDYDDFVATQQSAIRSEILGKSGISEVGYTVKRLLFEYLSLVAGHRGEVYYLAGEGRKRLVERYFGGDGLDAPKLVRLGVGSERTAFRMNVSLEMAQRSTLPPPIDGEEGIAYLQRVYTDLRIRRGQWNSHLVKTGHTTMGAYELYESLQQPFSNSPSNSSNSCKKQKKGEISPNPVIPDIFVTVVKRCILRLLPPWRVNVMWNTLLSVSKSLPTLGGWLPLACIILQRVEYARVEYGTPLGGQAVEALMMALQQAALDSKHGVGVTAEERLEDLLIRAAPSKKIKIYLSGNVPVESIAPPSPSDDDALPPSSEYLLSQREVYPTSRIGRQADAQDIPWGGMGETPQSARGVCLCLEFHQSVTAEAWRQIKRHTSTKAIPSPFELRAHQDSAGLIEVACGVAEPPTHIALREVFAAHVNCLSEDQNHNHNQASLQSLEALSSAAVNVLRGWGALSRQQLFTTSEMLVRTSFCGLPPERWWEMLVANGEDDTITLRELDGDAIRDIRTGRPKQKQKQKQKQPSEEEDLDSVFASTMEKVIPGLKHALSRAIQMSSTHTPSLIEQCQRRVRGLVEEVMETLTAPGFILSNNRNGSMRLHTQWDTWPGLSIRHTEDARTEVIIDSVASETRSAPILALAWKLGVSGGSSPLGSGVDSESEAMNKEPANHEPVNQEEELAKKEAIEGYLRHGGEIPPCIPTTHPAMRGIYCDSPTTAEAALGLEEGRRTLLHELGKLFPDADPRHARLLTATSLVDGHQRGLRRSDQKQKRSPMELALYEAPRAAFTKAALIHHTGVEDTVVVAAAINIPVAVGTGLIRVDLRRDTPQAQVLQHPPGTHDVMGEILPPIETVGIHSPGRHTDKRKLDTPRSRPFSHHAWRGPGMISVTHPSE